MDLITAYFFQIKKTTTVVTQIPHYELGPKM